MKTMTYDPRKPQQYRRRAGFSIEEVARRARLTSRGVRWLESGAIPKADTLGRLASAFGVTVDAFFVVK